MPDTPSAPKEKMQTDTNEVVYPFPKRDFSDEEIAYGLWIGMAYTTTHPQMDGYNRMRERVFDFYSVSRLYQRRGKIQIEGGAEIQLRAGDCIVIPPNVKYVFRTDPYCGRQRKVHVDRSSRERRGGGFIQREKASCGVAPPRNPGNHASQRNSG